MTAAAIKKHSTAADALMSVNVRGRLVMDTKALRAKSALFRQLQAARRLNKALKKAKSK